MFAISKKKYEKACKDQQTVVNIRYTSMYVVFGVMIE